MVHQKKDELITDIFTVSEDRVRLGNYTIKTVKQEGKGRQSMFYSNYGKTEPKSFSIVGDKIYLDREELPNVIEFSLSFKGTSNYEGVDNGSYPLLKVEGILDDVDGKPMVRFGELVGYNIKERVEVLGGSKYE